MESITLIKDMAACIAAQFGKNTEVVVHDFGKGFESTIIHIENGHVTGRTIGGCPTNLFLQEIRKDTCKTKNFRYITHTSDGKTLRSSTINFFENEKLSGSICINQDITDYLSLERVVNRLSESDHFEQKKVVNNEMHTNTIQELLEGLITEGISNIGVPVSDMNKESKLKFLRFLDEKGIFLIQKSGVRICDLLNISKFTLYNYLDEIRK